MRGPVLPYALSVHGFINKIGNDAGFAAIIAVAILIIMVFVQARETSLVRDRAEDAEDRLAQLEQYAAQVGRQATAAQQAAQAATAQATQAAGAQTARAGQAPPGLLRPAAAPSIASRAVASRPVAVALAPFAPFGVGAPALSSATRLIPRSDVPVASAPVLATAPAPEVAATTVAPPPASATPTPTPPPASATPTPTPAPIPIPVPVPPPALAPSTAAAGSPAPPPIPVAPSGRAPRRDYGRSAEAEPRVGRGSLAIAAVLVVVIIVAAVLVITHHSSSSNATDSAHVASTTKGAKTKNSTSSTKGGKVVNVNPTHVRVAVLNGTTTNNLAADVSTKLNKVGFQQGETANFANPNQTSTTVGYLPGDRAQAIAVAKALGISASSVAQVSTTARQIVCPSGAAACADQIVVTVGADLNSDA
jgi:hypothetical protein